MPVENGSNNFTVIGPTFVFGGGGEQGGQPGPLGGLPFGAPLPFFGLPQLAKDVADTFFRRGDRREDAEQDAGVPKDPGVPKDNGEQADAGAVDDVADGIGDLVNDIDDQGLASDVNELEGELRELMADGDLSRESLGAAADRIGEMVNEIEDPKIAARLNELETQLRDAMPPAPPQADPEAIDAVADDLGELANDIDDQELAGKVNELETELRELMASGELTPDALDDIADRMGELVNDIDDQDIAARLNGIETDLRDAIPSGSGDSGGLTTEGNNVIDTGRYRIEAGKDQVTITDKETGESIKAWGDPHLVTSDGDKAQFHEENLTIDLPDGTKVTIQPTEKNGKGLSYVDRIAVTKGDEAVVMSGIHDNDISHTGVMDGEGVADGVDRSYEDGTVLETGAQIDDLFFTDENGDALEELVGEDNTQRFNEHMLDGRGGASDLGVEN